MPGLNLLFLVAVIPTNFSFLQASHVKGQQNLTLSRGF